MRVSRAGNSHANSQNWSKIKLVRDFMPILISCKFDEDPIKIEVAIVRTTFYPLYVYGILKGSNSHVNGPICPKIKPVQDFIASSLSASLNKSQSKMKSLLSRQHILKSMGLSREANSHANRQKWVKIELV